MIRSRECRKRKKEYLINLEKKVDRLEKENCELKEENKLLKESVSTRICFKITSIHYLIYILNHNP